MKHKTKITLLTAALLAAFPLQAQTDRTADVQFKAAEHKEQVEGDLKGAIEQYKKIAQSKDRSIAVQALIRMAECYQKLGDGESRRIRTSGALGPSRPPFRAMASRSLTTGLTAPGNIARCGLPT